MNTPFNTESIHKHLKTKTLGQKIHFLALTDSTQIVAVKLASEGAPEGMLVLADEQVAGRGRHEHLWESPGGVNLYFSLLFRPRGWSLERANEIQFLVAVATAEVLKKECGVSVELKWPNDIWANGRKLGGMILSTSAQSAQDVDYIVLGMGLNINAEASQFSPGVRDIATSVRVLTGKTFDRAILLARLLHEFERFYHDVQQHGFERVRQAWLALAPQMTGKEIRVSDATTLPGSQHFDDLRGISRGIDGQGHLLMQTADGRQLTVIDGALQK